MADTTNTTNNKTTILSDAMHKAKRRVVLKHIWKYDGEKDVRKLVDAIVASYQSQSQSSARCSTATACTPLMIENIRKPPKVGFAVLTLETEEMAQKLIQFVNEKAKVDSDDEVFKNKKGFAYEAECSAGDPDKDNEKHENGNSGDSNKRSNNDDEKNTNSSNKRPRRETPKPRYLNDDEVRDLLTPYWRSSKEQQLLRKQREMIKRCTIKIIQEIKKIFHTRDKEAKRNKHVKRIPVYEWATKKRAIELEQIIPSPIQFTYRNKCEFTFGYRYAPITTGLDTDNNLSKDGGNEEELTKTPTVGYMTSGWLGGVSLPHSTYNTPTECCGIADVLNDFLASSPIPPYDPKLHM